MRKEIFSEGEIYHIYNRGTDKRAIFDANNDRHRFLFYLCEMNRCEPVRNIGYYFGSESGRLLENTSGERHVALLGYVLMPNHYHLILKQLRHNGISSFMQKLGTAYAMYYNKRYQRAGVLFQGRYKAIRLTQDTHYNYLPFYTHANPLKLYPDVGTVDGQLEILRHYPWSSYRDYAGLPGSYGITNTSVLKELFAEDGGFIAYMTKWLENKGYPTSEAGPH
ncbi:MAG: transposase [Elusimicrobia bacterium]|nr:transposase [Elusimicrobiota bacterium]